MTASIALINPKFAHNIGGAVRAMSCFGTGTVLWTGDRCDDQIGTRLPREERMKAYKDVKWRKATKPLNELEDFTPVAIELVPGSQKLHQFAHPERALYVFGPEDGSLDKGIKVKCHQFVQIPSKHCLNLAAAVYITLYDRALKRWQLGIEDMPDLDEDRGEGWWHSPALEEGAIS